MGFVAIDQLYRYWQGSAEILTSLIFPCWITNYCCHCPYFVENALWTYKPDHYVNVMKVQVSVTKSFSFSYNAEFTYNYTTIRSQIPDLPYSVQPICIFPLPLSLSLLPLSPYSLSPPWRSAHQHWFIIYSRAWETSSYWFNAYSNPALYPLLVRDAGA